MPRSGLRILLIALIALFILAVVDRRALRGGETAVVAGEVADSAGMPLAGARVTLSGDGVRPVTLRTNVRGVFRFWGVPAGPGYRVAAERAGYRGVEYDGIALETARERVVNFRLKRPGDRDVVVLVSRDPFPCETVVTGFLDGLGVPARVIDLDAEADPAGVVRRVAAERPDLVLSTGLRAGRLVRSEVHDVPAILTLISDPRRYDLEAGNICFLANNPDAGKTIDRLLAILPRTRRIGILYDADHSELLARDLRQAAGRRGLAVVIAPCYRALDVRATLAGLAGRIDVLVVPYDPLAASPGVARKVSAWARRWRVPLMAPQPDWVERGALFSYSVPLRDLGRQAQGMARDILFHARQPEDFELRQPRGPTLAVNRATAAALGIVLPEPDGGAPGGGVPRGGLHAP